MNFLITHHIDEHARCSPEAPAVKFLQDQLSYAELAHASDQMASCLVQRGVRRGDRVGIYMNKSLKTPVAMYGIMKAGAAYVPLDPSAPPARIAEIIGDCGISVLVTANNRKRQLREIVGNLCQSLLAIGIDSTHGMDLEFVSWSEVQSIGAVGPPQVRILAADLAYIIYTSGSTGTPKGIMHTHASGLSFAHWAVSEYALQSVDLISNHAPLHFDLSIFDYFGAAVAGACTVIIPEEYTRLPASYSQLIADQRITVLFTVPFALIQLQLHGVLEDRELGSLRWVIFGGEPMPLKYLRDLMQRLPGTRFDNMYGPAEVNGVTHYTVQELAEETSTIPIGPMAVSAESLILDDTGNEVEPGQIGELLVRSPTMMQGYWQCPELNSRAFFVQLRDDEIRAVYYRTGDLVVSDSAGTLWFHGRKDRQIKVRGYRVELDEIESILASHEKVAEAAIYSKPGDKADSEIRAAAIPLENSQLSEDQLAEYLKARLPWYALPLGISLRNDFPRTATGKIDRRALSQEAVE